MTSGGFTSQQRQASYLALGRAPQARGRAAMRAQLLRRVVPGMPQAEAGGATVWRMGSRLLRLAGILGSQCLHALHLSMKARQVAIIRERTPCRRSHAWSCRQEEWRLPTMYA